jgi:hypothetical protein
MKEILLQNLAAEAKQRMLLHPTPPYELSIPAYYEDPVVADAARASLISDSDTAYILALSYKLTGDKLHGDRAVWFLNTWGQTNKLYSNNVDTLINLANKGQKFIAAAEMLLAYHNDLRVFDGWVESVFLPGCKYIRNNSNNVGSMGSVGIIQAYKYLQEIDAPQTQEAIWHMKSHTLNAIAGEHNPFGQPGELWRENLRNIDGLWYYYFALSAMLKGAYLAKPVDPSLLYDVKPTLDIYFDYCTGKREWIYNRWSYPIRWLQKIIFPTDNVRDIPVKNELMEVAGFLYRENTWTDWVSDARPFSNSNYWPYSTLQLECGLII